jgi:UDPglucose--hexose-1-phosphate uridylyltransferase
LPELRYNPLFGRYVVVAPERDGRPQARDEEAEPWRADPAEDPFLPGHEDQTPPELFALRPDGGVENGPGWQVRSFTNKYPALAPDADSGAETDAGPYRVRPGHGAHEVLVDTPEPDEDWGDMPLEQLVRCLRTFQLRIDEIYRDPAIQLVLPFKNHGPDSGATQQHSHCQIIGLPLLSPYAEAIVSNSRSYFEATGQRLLFAMLSWEKTEATRMVATDGGLVAFCPFAASSPYEVWLTSERPCADFVDLVPGELLSLARLLQDVISRLDACLEDASYNAIIHTVPRNIDDTQTGAGLEDCYQWHLQIFPRLGNTGGFEWGSGMNINSVAPEEAARLLRNREKAKQ